MGVGEGGGVLLVWVPGGLTAGPCSRLRRVGCCAPDCLLCVLSSSCLTHPHQVVNIPSFMVRVDSQKHIDFALTSPFGGGRAGRVKRKSAA